MVVKNSAQVARGAADAIDKFGWTKGEYGSEEVGFCLMGAMIYAAREGKPLEQIAEERGFSSKTGGNTYLIWSDALNAFRTWLREAAGASPAFGPRYTIPYWNDCVCFDKEEATLHLRKFAEDMDSR